MGTLASARNNPRRSALCILLAIGLAGTSCDNSVEPAETAVKVNFSLTTSTTAPDSLFWSFAGAKGAAPSAPYLDAGVTAYSVSGTVAKKVSRDTLTVVLKTLSVTTLTLKYIAGQDANPPSLVFKQTDTIGSRLMLRYDSLHQLDSTRLPWTHASVTAFYAKLLATSDTGFSGYPRRCPVGIDTALVDSLILRNLVDSKDSVGRFAATWHLTWTPAQVRATLRSWLEKGRISMGQYDILYPFEDLPPSQVRPIGFVAGPKDSVATSIMLGAEGIRVVGAFADDSGIVSQSLSIWSTPSGSAPTLATDKFTVVATPIGILAPVQSWDLKTQAQIGIKTTTATQGLYRLDVAFADRKGQVFTASFNFSVNQKAVVVIDEIAPAITLVRPLVRADTVDDTTSRYEVRFGVSDENLRAILLDKDTALRLDGMVSKTISLTEGQSTMVRIYAVDTAGNFSRDSVSVYRRKAVPPTLTRVGPGTGIDTVADIVPNYTFRWKVEGVDIRTVTIDTFPVLPNQTIAELVLPLKLGANNWVKIRVVDALKHVKVDSVQVFRRKSVAPLITRKGVAAGLIVVPDTQSLFTAAWTVQDNNLDQLLVLGAAATLADGAVATTVYLKAGDTAKIPVWASDKLGSISTDTIKVYRPDPRKPYATEIAAAQRGDSVVALSDFVLPNVRFGRFEVTTGLYAKVMKVAGLDGLGKPMVNVSIYDAMLFCNAMSKAAGLDTFYTYASRDLATGYFKETILPDTIRKAGVLTTRIGFRLPYDSEWQKAASPKSGLYPWGISADPKIVDQFARWNTSAPGLAGAFLPTGKGLFDLAGNASEWVYQTDGFIGIGTRRYTRGGNATSPLGDLVVYDENAEPLLATSKSPLIGFRVVRVGSI